MAQRRMFSKTITNSSQFLRMPISSRLLYYDLGMNADDDGFVEHFMVLRMTGATQQDLGVLELNGLIKVFDDNVLWIKDWKENNYIQKDRYKPSKYLSIYSLDTLCIQDGYSGKVRLELGKGSIYEHIEQEFGRPLSPIEYEIVGSWEDNDLTRYAIKQAILNNAPRIKYIQAILNSYKSKNIKTVLEAQEDEKRYKNRSSNNQTKPNWMDEEIEKETISDEEKKELQNLMNEFE